MGTTPLEGRVALVTGASRGIGRGIAIGLGEARATVVVTGRSDLSRSDAPTEALADTARRVTEAGGTGIAIPCDHRDDTDVARLFRSIADRFGRLDLLVNNATLVPDFGLVFSETPFWEVPIDVLDGFLDVGVRSDFVAAQHAARPMIDARRGLIVNISSSGAVSKFAIAPYGIAKAAIDKMTADLAADLAATGVTVVSYWPPASATERMLESVGPDDDPTKWADPVFNGRVIAALAASPDLAERTGRALAGRALAAELGVTE